jgi:1-phosphofructokinase family hexose kinase
MDSAILCVTANAAVDKTALVGSFRLGEIHRPTSLIALAGGKGNNVARALNTLGEKVVASGWVGGYSGRFIEAELQREGIETAFVHRQEESRTCLSVLDESSGVMTEVYERGEPVLPEELGALITWFSGATSSYRSVVLAGSIPPGVPSDFYARLIEVAHAAGVPVYLDASGAALREGLAAQPALIKPNKQEFADLVGSTPTSIAEYADAASRVALRCKGNVVLSLGADGAIAAGEHGRWWARPPHVNVVSAVGSGDSLLAGVLSKRGSLDEMLRRGVAAGTANTLRLGAGVFTREDFNNIYANVVVDSL